MATAVVPLRHAAPTVPRASSSGQRVTAAAHACLPRGRRLRSRRSLTTVSAAAGTSSGGSALAEADGARAWDALGGVSVLAAGTGEAVPLTDMWDPTEVLVSRFRLKPILSFHVA